MYLNERIQCNFKAIKNSEVNMFLIGHICTKDLLKKILNEIS